MKYLAKSNKNNLCNKFSIGSGDFSNVLRYVIIPVISNTECKDAFGSNIVTATTLCCSGDEGKSTCNVCLVNYFTKIV